MLENEDYENQCAQGARKVAELGRQIAAVAGVRLIDLKWLRGQEVAELDNYWLTLVSSKDAVTERFPNEWLAAPDESAHDRQIDQRLHAMVQALVAGAGATAVAAP